MTNTELRSSIDKLWTEFWTGGITNPLSVIEQINYLFFCRMLDDAEIQNERVSKRLEKAYISQFFNKDSQDLRWSYFKHLGGDELLNLMRDKVFPFLRSLGNSSSQNENKLGIMSFMKDAQLLIVKPSLLKSAISFIDELPLDDSDSKGDLYEYLLSKLSTAGINGQFRTPRHIQECMVEMLEPQPTDTIADPACGTAGFLVKSMEYLRKKHTTPEMIYKNDSGKNVYVGDMLTPYEAHINNNMFYGFDFDLTMLRVSAMNMMLHGITGQTIHYQDTLADSFRQNYAKEAKDYFDIILANPPFKGNLDVDSIATELLKKVKSTKTELLFLVRMWDMLKLGGRCAVIVPDGVLFGSSKAHIALRSLLLDENQLDAVISLPSGVFKPYAGVSTAILFFTKGGKSEDIFFYNVTADGYSLDDKRMPTKENDLPNLITTWQAHKAKSFDGSDRKAKAFYVNAEEIRKNNYDLSINKYKEEHYEAVEYDAPQVILSRMEKMENEISDAMQKLKEMV